MNSQAPPFDLAIGLDRADRKADLHLLDLPSGKAHSQTISTAPEDLQGWVCQLRERYPTLRIAICFEQPANHLITFLASLDWITLYPINPLTLLKFREAFVLSRAKDDAKDAEFMAHLLATHHTLLTPWQPEDLQTQLLRRLVTDRRSVVDHRTSLCNRLQALLKDYFPQALELAGEDLWRPLATAFLRRWPTLQAVQKAKPETLRGFYRGQGSRSEELLQSRLDRIVRAVPVTDNLALVESYVIQVTLTAKELDLVRETIEDYDQRIASVFADHPDRQIFRNLPGAGPTLAPRLLATLGTQRDRYPTAAALINASGISPVCKQSGHTRHVHRRYRCSVFFKQSIHEWAGQTILWCDWARACYDMKRAAGSGHHAAIRALAYKWLRILWRCWQDRQPYDEAKYLAALRKAGSPLIAWMDKNPPTTQEKKTKTTKTQ